MNMLSKKTYIIGIITILFLTLIVNYMDRSAIAYAIQPIKHDFGLNNAQFGLIGAAFGFGYLLMTLIGGILVDRYFAHRVLTVSSLIWSVVCILLGFATNFWMLFVLRVLLGVAEGPSFPAVTQVIANWLPLSWRVRTMSFVLAAVPFASVLGAPIISHLIITFNWRLTFIILGSFGEGILITIIWFAFYRDAHTFDKSKFSEPLADQVISQKTTWRFLLLNRSLMANNYAYFTYGYLFFFALTWLPGYLEQDYGLKLKQVGWFLTIPWLTATVLLIVGGTLSDKLLERTDSLRRSRSHVIWICQLLSALCFLTVIFEHSLTTALIFISLGLGFSLMPNAVFYSLNIDLAKDRAATHPGIMDCFFALGGILAPALTGLLAHLTGNFNAAIFLLSVLTLSSVLGIILFQHPDKASL